MPANDWFRNKEWSGEVAARFFEKLRRAKDKAQYLRVQASCLADSDPKAALSLLDQYFALGENWDWAEAFVVAATAHLSLGETNQAIRSLRNALEKERQPPSVQTTAWSMFALLVAERRMESHFEEALQVLTEHGTRFAFPVEEFQWHAAYALILAAQGDRSAAREHATKALHASHNRSG